jgi:ABC-type transport system involved in multi-copper enzyme maturation permease subunit
MAALFWFTVRQVLWQRKIWLTLALLAGPCALMLVIRHFESDPGPEDAWERLHVSIQFMIFMLVVPLICMLHGVSLIGSEVDGRTLVYLLTRRLRRPTVLLVRFAAVSLVLTALVVLGITGQYFCALGGVEVSSGSGGATGPVPDNWQPAGELWTYLGTVPLAVAAFMGIFTLFGLLTARPLAASMIYLVLVEVFNSNMPLGMRAYSVSHQLRMTWYSSIPNLSVLYELPSDLASRVFPPGSSGTANLCSVLLITLVLACVLMTTRELVTAKLAGE